MAAPAVSGAVALCLGNGGTPGPCAELTPPEIMNQIRDDAAAASHDGWGFVGDPLMPLAVGRFGHLVSAACY